MEFSAEDIIQFEHQVKYVMDHATLYADQEKCEAFARLGIANFFGGQYTKAITALEEALKYRNVAKPDKYIVFVYVLLGNIFFRCNDLNRSEKHFKSAIMLRKVDEGLACIALSNTAVIKVTLNNMKSASEKASEAIKMASRLYPPSSEEVSLIKHLLSALISTN